jgi:hydroxymethylglutaryl-CoA synthase
MTEALADFRKRAVSARLFREDQYLGLSDRWARMIFHLPYAFHAKRMFVEEFIKERKNKGLWEKDCAKYHFQEPDQTAVSDSKTFGKAQVTFLKLVSESAMYRRFVQDKLERAQRASQETGNLYTASIFLALMSSLECDAQEQNNLSGKRLGFIAYGSGSKSKVFEAVVQKDWMQVASRFNIFEKLSRRRAIDYHQYELLHTGAQTGPVFKEENRWGLQRIGQEGVTLGARYYGV